MTKNRLLNCLSAIFILGLAGLGRAQDSGLPLDQTGASVVFQTEIRPSSGKEQPSQYTYFSRWVENGKLIHRIIGDPESGMYFGYDVAIEFTEQTGKYKVSVKPLSSNTLRIYDPLKIDENKRVIGTTKPGAIIVEKKVQPLSKYPASLIVETGDTIELNILENPQSKQKLIDIIRIVSKSNSIGTTNPGRILDTQSVPSRKPARDLTPEAIELKLNNCKFFVNNKQIASLHGIISGTTPYIYFQGKGIYAFSLFARPGYDFKKIGSIESNKISFEIDGNNYEIVSSSPILEMSGNWNLWVLHDLNYKPQMAQRSPYLIGTIESLENFSRKK